jgi:D-alanine-D-alanine ligase
MRKINKHIEIVRSPKTWLSSMSQVSSDAIQKSLLESYKSVVITEIDSLSDLRKLVFRKPDLVFLGMKFLPAENTTYSQHSPKIWLAEYLEKYEIAHTGSDSRAHELELSKPDAKQRIIDDGLDTSPYYVVGQNTMIMPIQVKIDYPLFVKPSNLGGSVGIDDRSVVNNYNELVEKIQSIKNIQGSDSLVERYLTGREFSVAILKNSITNKLQAMPIEIVATKDKNGNTILSSDVKSENKEEVLSIDDKNIKALVCDLAISVFNSLGARDYGRIDVRFDNNNVPQFLEANLIPSLIDGYGNFPKACKINLSMDYKPMLLNIVNLGLLRSIHVKEEMPTDLLNVDTITTFNGLAELV